MPILHTAYNQGTFVQPLKKKARSYCLSSLGIPLCILSSFSESGLVHFFPNINVFMDTEATHAHLDELKNAGGSS